MPNHVTSRVIVTGPSAEVARFQERFIVTKMEKREPYWAKARQPQPYTTFDFGAIIPMPAALEGAEESSHAEIGMAMITARGSSGAPFANYGLYDAQIQHIREATGLPARTGISEVAAAYLAANPDVEDASRKRMIALAKTGFASWYPWAIVNWGTKWGAYSFALESSDPLTVKFETAWAFPTPVFEALVAEFPTLTFDCICFDEGWNFAGVGTFGATGEPFAEVKATDELYEQVYGRKPERDEDEDDG